uniref:CcoQ n=1 Tax=Cereibacter sphaeroides TaxID=1063 RepID=Q53102_CERSP|nr:CcoQ [Cereibacter sphaeroides]
MMTLFFVGVVFWAWRPRSRKDHDEAASAIFRHETKPADDDPVSSSEEARK